MRGSSRYEDSVPGTLGNRPAPHTMLSIQPLSEVRVQVHELIVNGVSVGGHMHTSFFVDL